nr:hypothetical protein [uncultured Acinetobacter sp.]
MKWIVFLLFFFIGNCYAGFESTLETVEKRREVKINKNKEYIESAIGKTAWYNSDQCVIAKIYKDKSYVQAGEPYIGKYSNNDMEYDDSTFQTNGDYVSVKFIEGEITKNDEILYTLEIAGKEKGYLKVAPLFYSVFKEDYGVNCLKKEKPNNETGSSTVNIEYDSKKWSSGGCKKDKFNGVKSCEIRNDRLYVVILDGKKLVWIVGADYPNKQSAIKIDTNKTIFGTDGKFSNNSIIINQLLNGKTANIRYVQWPYRYNVDSEIDLNGFRSAYEEMLKEYEKLK